MPRTVFLLSPADARGTRAKQMASPRATFSVARAFRSPDGVPIEDAFAFMSALYFRGKIAYARRFADPTVRPGDSIHVITSGYGLVPMGWRLNPDRMRRLRRIPVDPKRPAYRRPLLESAEALLSRLDDEVRIVLLGSIATGKYLDLLAPLFGTRFLFPRAFAGIGDMQRGALMLRAAASGDELEYAGLEEVRSFARSRSGSRRPS